MQYKKLIDLLHALLVACWIVRDKKREVDAEGTVGESIDTRTQEPVEKALNRNHSGGPTLDRPASVFTRVRKKRKTDSSVDD